MTESAFQYKATFTHFALPIHAECVDGKEPIVLGFRVKKGDIFYVTDRNEEIAADQVRDLFALSA